MAAPASGSQSSAARMPTIRPIRPPTAAPVRLFAPAVLVADAAETILPTSMSWASESC